MTIHEPELRPGVISLGAESATVRLVAVGDVALGLRVGEALEAQGPAFCLAPVKHLLSDSDIRFGNLEFPLTRALRPHPIIRHRPMHAPPSTVQALVDARFDLMSIANNHIFDYLIEGLDETVATLECQGIGCVGAGSILAAARRPAIRSVNGVTLAFLAYTFPRHQIASSDIPGCAPAYPEVMVEDVRNLKGLVNHIVVSLHAGSDFSYYPTELRQAYSRLLIDEGAVAVLHHHPHVPNGIEIHKGGLVAYGLGTFLFDIHDEYLQAAATPHTSQGMALVLSFDKDRLVAFEVRPTVIHEDLTVHPMTDAGEKTFFGLMNTLSAPLYQPDCLRQLHPDLSYRAKVVRWLKKIPAQGPMALIRESSRDVYHILDRNMLEPRRLRAMTRALSGRKLQREPNPPVKEQLTFVG